MALKKATHTLFERIEHLLIMAVLLAAVVMAASHGYMKGRPAGLLWAGVCMLALIACVGMEFRAAKRMVAAWFERQPGQMIGWAMLWAVCAFSTLYVSYGTAAFNTDRAASVHKAAFTAYTDASKAKSETEIALGRYERELATLAIARPEAAVESEIAKAQTTRAFLNSGQCADPQTKEQRSVCQGIRNLRAEAAVARRRVEIESKVAALRAELKGQRAAPAAQEVVVGEEESNIAALVLLTGASPTVARKIDAMQLSLLIQAMLTLGAILLTIDYYSDRPRRPWVDWSRLWEGAPDQPAKSEPAAPATPAPTSTALVPTAPTVPRQASYMIELPPGYVAGRDHVTGRLIVRPVQQAA